MSRTKLTPWLGSALLGLLALGCVSSAGSKELMDARVAYRDAQEGPGARLSPVPLHEAKVALDAAEQASAIDSDSELAVGLSYVADRKARLARAQGNASYATAQRAEALKGLAYFQSQDLANTKAGLASTKGELSTTQERLAAEKAARATAELAARDAMDRLRLAASLAIKEEPRGTVILLPGSVLFASNKSDLLPTAQSKLDAVAEALKNQEDRRMVVEGHTDSQGSEASNMDLALRRAQSVRDYLVAKGVGAEQISASGIGQGRPIADNKSPEGRANNRRVEIVIQSIEKR